MLKLQFSQTIEVQKNQNIVPLLIITTQNPNVISYPLTYDNLANSLANGGVLEVVS